MATPDSTFLTFCSTYLTGSHTARRITDSDGVDRIYVGIRLVPDLQLQNVNDGGKPTLVFKVDQRVAAALWPLVSSSISGSF
jgi:hypothetical protein